MKNSDDPSNYDYPNLPEPEQKKLRRIWDNGTLAPRAVLLRDYAREHRIDILSAAGWSGDTQTLVAAIKGLVVEQGTVHFHSEMLDQKREIHNDIWYHGERGDYDRKRIANEWPLKHGANWRCWRIKEYVFVIGKIADELVDICCGEEN